MAIRGQRFHIDLSSDDETDLPIPAKPSGPPSFGFVKDIRERSTPLSAPSAPRLKSSDCGFPAHNKKRSRPSAFKQARANQQPKQTHNEQEKADTTTPDPAPSRQPSHHHHQQTEFDEARRDIDEENKSRMAQMSTEEIEEARQELLTALSPSLIERLLRKGKAEEGNGAGNDEIGPRPENPHRKSLDREEEENLDRLLRRANIDEGEGTGNGEEVEPPPPAKNTPLKPVNREANENPVKKKKVTFTALSPTSPYIDPDASPRVPPSDLLPASSTPFPAQVPTDLPSPPPLDPSDPNFLTSLRETYFPSLPSSPSSLSWLAPPAPGSSTYSPSLLSLPPSSLRFDFRGHLLPPRLAAQIPATKGLHHHGDAPEAAGYTIPELARLARSTFPAQRCIAFQTLGRVLFRLGRGDFGKDEEGEGGELAEGLWELVELGKVLDILLEVAGSGEKKGNRSCWVTATEAVWMWRKGGGRRWKAK